MAKIDRLGWAAGMSLVAYGVRVGVRTNQRDVLKRLHDRFPPGWRRVESPVVERLYSLRVGGASPRANIRQFNLLYGDITRVARALDLDQVLDVFESNVKLYVAFAARRRVFVHAGVVGWRGQAIMIPGLTLSGKSTLVTALVRAGATYYSDEYAVLDSEGRVHPYAKPLGLRENFSPRQKRVPVERLGGVAGRKPLPVGLVVLTQYRSNARWRPRELSPGQAVLAVLAHTVPARRRPEAALATLGRVTTSAVVLKSLRGDVEEVVDSLLSRLPA
jgi:hypothetical protein